MRFQCRGKAEEQWAGGRGQQAGGEGPHLDRARCHTAAMAQTPVPQNERRAQQRLRKDFRNASSDQRVRACLERCAERVLRPNLSDELAMSTTGTGQARGSRGWC